jgi:F420-0:gamma-glutamyl ligase
MKIQMLSAPLFHVNEEVADEKLLGEKLIEYIASCLLPESSSLEGSVLCITSKIVSLAEHRIVSRKAFSKADLIEQEAEVYLGEVAYGTYLTVKENLFLASAGVDESNSPSEDFILLPKHPSQTASNLQRMLSQRFNIRNLGVILTDSRTGFLRYGVTGAAIGSAGFRVLRDCVGEKDLFSRPLKMTKINVADALATAAVFLMGESSERTPLALITDIPPGKIEFCAGSTQDQLYVPNIKGEFPTDLYWPFLAPGFNRPFGPGT